MNANTNPTNPATLSARLLCASEQLYGLLLANKDMDAANEADDRSLSDLACTLASLANDAAALEKPNLFWIDADPEQSFDTLGDMRAGGYVDGGDIIKVRLAVSQRDAWAWFPVENEDAEADDPQMFATEDEAKAAHAAHERAMAEASAPDRDTDQMGNTYPNQDGEG